MCLSRANDIHYTYRWHTVFIIYEVGMRGGDIFVIFWSKYLLGISVIFTLFQWTESVYQIQISRSKIRQKLEWVFMKHYAPNICLPLKIPWKQDAKVGKGAYFFQIFMKICQKLSGHLHLGHNMCAKYHDPSSSSSPDILLTRFHRFTMHKSKKGYNSVKYSQNFM